MLCYSVTVSHTVICVWSIKFLSHSHTTYILFPLFAYPDDITTPPGDYAQETPTREFLEKFSGPPILPPHLLQVILNKDIGPQVCTHIFIIIIIIIYSSHTKS